MNTQRWSKCPLCSGMNIGELGPIAYRQPIRFSTQEIVLERTPLLFECRQCKSWFTQNVIPQDLAFSMYQSGASSEKWPDTPLLSEGKSCNIIARLNQHIVDGTRVLDVGANTGELLDHARSRGAQAFGVEPSNASREVLARKGHHIFSCMEVVTGSFDVIAAFDLIEHLYDLPAFLRWAYEQLVPGGVLIILTGDNSSLSARKSRERWWYLKAPEHIIFPSEKYFEGFDRFQIESKDTTFASVGYERNNVIQYLQFIRKSIFAGGYDGLPPFGPDHMLLTLRKA